MALSITINGVRIYHPVSCPVVPGLSSPEGAATQLSFPDKLQLTDYAGNVIVILICCKIDCGKTYGKRQMGESCLSPQLHKVYLE